MALFTTYFILYSEDGAEHKTEFRYGCSYLQEKYNFEGGYADGYYDYYLTLPFGEFQEVFNSYVAKIEVVIDSKEYSGLYQLTDLRGELCSRTIKVLRERLDTCKKDIATIIHSHKITSVKTHICEIEPLTYFGDDNNDDLLDSNYEKDTICRYGWRVG